MPKLKKSKIEKVLDSSQSSDSSSDSKSKLSSDIYTDDSYSSDSSDHLTYKQMKSYTGTVYSNCWNCDIILPHTKIPHLCQTCRNKLEDKVPMINTVYIVNEYVEYEGPSEHGCFYSKSEAHKVAKACANYYCYDTDEGVEEVEENGDTVYKYRDVTWSVIETNIFQKATDFDFYKSILNDMKKKEKKKEEENKKKEEENKKEEKKN